MDFVSELPVHVVLEHIFPRLNYTSWVRAGAVNREWRSLAAMAPPLGDYIPSICLTDGELHSNVRAASITDTDCTLCPIAFTGHSISISIPSDDPDRENLAFFCNSKTGNSFPLPVAPGKRIVSTFSGRPTSQDHPGTSPVNWVAAALNSNPTSFVCIYSHGWTCEFETENELCDIIFHNNQLYAIDKFREIVAFDISSNVDRQPPRVVLRGRKDHYWRINWCYATYYLVESSSGGLYVVTRDISEIKQSITCPEPKFTVHRVDEDNEELVEVEDLGDEMFFVERGCSMSIMYGSRAWSVPFFKRNCIYFFSNSCFGPYIPSSCKVGSYCMEKKMNRISFHQSRLPEYSSLPQLWIQPGT